MVIAFVPGHVNERTGPVDNLGGVLSVLMVAALVLAINFAPVPGHAGSSLALAALACLAAAAFVARQRRAPVPLYDLAVAAAASSAWPRSPGSSCSAR
jgi:MFS transporter, DHA2 family, multidrug resistance protein